MNIVDYAKSDIDNETNPISDDIDTGDARPAIDGDNSDKIPTKVLTWEQKQNERRERLRSRQARNEQRRKELLSQKQIRQNHHPTPSESFRYWLARVEKNGLDLQHAPNKYQGNKQIVMAAVKECGWALEHSSLELKNDKDVVVVAVSKSGSVLRHASSQLQKDAEILSKIASQKLIFKPLVRHADIHREQHSPVHRDDDAEEQTFRCEDNKEALFRDDDAHGQVHGEFNEQEIRCQDKNAALLDDIKEEVPSDFQKQTFRCEDNNDAFRADTFHEPFPIEVKKEASHAIVDGVEDQVPGEKQKLASLNEDHDHAHDEVRDEDQKLAPHDGSDDNDHEQVQCEDNKDALHAVDAADDDVQEHVEGREESPPSAAAAVYDDDDVQQARCDEDDDDSKQAEPTAVAETHVGIKYADEAVRIGEDTVVTQESRDEDNKCAPTKTNATATNLYMISLAKESHQTVPVRAASEYINSSVNHYLYHKRAVTSMRKNRKISTAEEIKKKTIYVSTRRSLGDHNYHSDASRFLQFLAEDKYSSHHFALDQGCSAEKPRIPTRHDCPRRTRSDLTIAFGNMSPKYKDDPFNSFLRRQLQHAKRTGGFMLQLIETGESYSRKVPTLCDEQDVELLIANEMQIKVFQVYKPRSAGGGGGSHETYFAKRHIKDVVSAIKSWYDDGCHNMSTSVIRPSL